MRTIALALLVALGGCSFAWSQNVTSSPTSSTMTIATLSSSCSVAEIAEATHDVTIDWGCVERRASEYKDGHVNIFPAIAIIMKAIRDGTAKTK